MELLDPRYTAHNVSTSTFEHPDSFSEYFTLTAPANSRIWRKPNEDDTSAPMILTCLCQSFILAEVSVSSALDAEFDQAGLVIFADRPPIDASVIPSTTRRRRSSTQRREDELQVQSAKWVTAALQLSNGEIGLSTTVAQPYCGPDWSFTPIQKDSSATTGFTSAISNLKIKLERVGQDLWIWYNIPTESSLVVGYRSPREVSQEWKKAREIASFFTGVEPKGGVYVGCYASRPLEMDEDEEREKGGLFAEFEDLEIL